MTTSEDVKRAREVMYRDFDLIRERTYERVSRQIAWDKALEVACWIAAPVIVLLAIAEVVLWN